MALAPEKIIELLNASNSRLDKEAVLLEAWNQQSYDFFQGCQLAYDGLMSFGVKKVAKILIEGSEDTSGDYPWDEFKELANKLHTRQLTGHAARDAIHQAASRADGIQWNNWYRAILLKDLRCGITDTTINKVLKEIGGDALNYLVPKFSCQLAQNAEDNPKKIVGKKYCDFKLDGVRLLTILDKENGTITQFTRNGAENTNFTNIIKSLENILPYIPGSLVLDGEVVSKSFQELMTQVNRKVDVDTNDAKLALFDIVPLKDFLSKKCDVPLKKRHEVLASMEGLFQEYTKESVYVIPKLLVDLDTEEGRRSFMEFNREAIESGFEGIMIKDPDSPYESKRTSAWLKMKPFISIDLKITSVEIGTGKNANRLGNINGIGYENDKEITSSVGSGYSDNQREEIWKNRDAIIGDIMEVHADAITQNKDGTYSLRFPRFHRFRSIDPESGKI